jgi:NitT/TauT family transport system substrate-binding protein
MTKFRIMPHGRLQEWVADEKGYFSEEGLDYEFVRGGSLERGEATVQHADGAPAAVLTGAFESMAAGRACDVSSACHWAVNMASSAQHGRMWGHAYSVTPGAILVARDSAIRTPDDLREAEIGVGYHSGSHFSCLQAMSAVMPAKEVKLRFIGGPGDRVDLMREGKIEAVNVFGMQKDILEQLGCRRVLDTTFMIGFLVQPDAAIEEVQRYFNALRRAQRDIDVAPERYKHYYLRELPAKYHSLVDVRAFSAGERIVFEPYTRELYEQTHRWMQALSIFPPEQLGERNYAEAVIA